jgi:hypothetical protein
VMLGAAAAAWTPTADVAASTRNCVARSRAILFRPLSARLFLRKTGQSVGVAAIPGNLERARFCCPISARSCAKPAADAASSVPGARLR